MRLTNDLRDKIVRSAVQKVFAERRNDLKKEDGKLAMLVYDILYPKDIQNRMNALPAEFFNQSSHVYALDSATSRSSEYIKLTLTSSRRISARDNSWKAPCLTIHSVDTPLACRIRTLVKKQGKCDLDQANLETHLRRMLAGIHTLKQLQAEWPDGADYYAGVTPTPPVINVPAIRGVDITAMILGLEEVCGDGL